MAENKIYTKNMSMPPPTRSLIVYH